MTFEKCAKELGKLSPGKFNTVEHQLYTYSSSNVKEQWTVYIDGFGTCSSRDSLKGAFVKMKRLVSLGPTTP